jgi:predicted  nucleic acid-binding Zn-ribbon protein
MEMAPLLVLQEIDTAIDRMTARKHVLESGGELASAHAEADAAERALGELRLQLDVVGRDQTKLEHEIDSLSQKAAAEDSVSTTAPSRTRRSSRPSSTRSRT